jgi:hypothetical protein
MWFHAPLNTIAVFSLPFVPSFPVRTLPLSVAPSDAIAQTEAVTAPPTRSCLCFFAKGALDTVRRHAVACPFAFAVGLVVVALRPSRARGLLPVSAALAASLVVTATIDISRGVTPILAEADHLTEIASALLVWLNARRVSHPSGRNPACSIGALRVARI